uniref:Secreted protein n=1 Tax=Panagrellus redivivus TaxID=6233 RepID=A0A7E4V139_PANRE
MSVPVYQVLTVAIIISLRPNSMFQAVSVANFLAPSSRRMALQHVKADPTQAVHHVKFECPYSHSLVHYRTFELVIVGVCILQTSMYFSRQETHLWH